MTVQRINDIVGQLSKDTLASIEFIRLSDYDRHDVATDVATELLVYALYKTGAEPILSLEVQPDHIHLFVSIPPATSVADAIKILKGSTARKLFVKFPELKKQLWGGHLWSPSYYVGTAGNVSSETIQKYIERTEHIKGRR